VSAPARAAPIMYLLETPCRARNSFPPALQCLRISAYACRAHHCHDIQARAAAQSADGPRRVHDSFNRSLMRTGKAPTAAATSRARLRARD